MKQKIYKQDSQIKKKKNAEAGFTKNNEDLI